MMHEIKDKICIENIEQECLANDIRSTFEYDSKIHHIFFRSRMCIGLVFPFKRQWCINYSILIRN